MDEERAVRAVEVANAVAHAMAAPAEELVEAVVRAALAVFGAAGASLAVVDRESDELVFTTVSGAASGSVTGMRMPVTQGIAGWVATTGEPLAVGDLTRDPRFASEVASATGYLPRTILACPVAAEEQVLGVIEVLDRDEHRARAEDDLQLLSVFARQTALALLAVERSRRLGAVLAGVLESAGAADLAARLRERGESPELVGVAAPFAALATAGPRERRLAGAVLEAVAGWAADPA